MHQHQVFNQEHVHEKGNDEQYHGRIRAPSGITEKVEQEKQKEITQVTFKVEESLELPETNKPKKQEKGGKGKLR